MYVTQPMQTAPKNGTRILLHHKPVHYAYGGWVCNGTKWEECRWVSNKKNTGSNPHFEPWCGDLKTHSSEHIQLENCIEWMELPK